MDLIPTLYLISGIVVFLNLAYAACLDVMFRRVKFRAWYPMIIICTPLSGLYYIQLFLENPYFTTCIELVVLFCAGYYVISRYLKAFGGADAWSLIFITLFIPIAPAAAAAPISQLTPSLTVFFPIAVIAGFAIALLFVPIALLIVNLIKGNKAPWYYLMTCQYISVEDLFKKIGYIMNDIPMPYATEGEGVKGGLGGKGGEGVSSRVRAHYAQGLREGVREGDTHTYLIFIEFAKRILKKDLKYRTEYFINHMLLYEKDPRSELNADKLWVTYTVPLILPMTVGYVMAYIAGYILFF